MLQPTIEPGSLCCSGLVRADALRTVSENCATFGAEDLATGRPCLLHELSLPGRDPSLARHFQLAVRRLRDFPDSPLTPLIYTFTGVSSFFIVEAVPEGPSLDRISPRLAGDELAGAFRAVLRALAALHGADPPLFHGALEASRVFPASNSYGVVLAQPAYILRWLTGGNTDAPRYDVAAAAWLTALLGSDLPDFSEDIQTLPLRATFDWILDEQSPQTSAAVALSYFENVLTGVGHHLEGDIAGAHAAWRKALEQHRYAGLLELLRAAPVLPATSDAVTGVAPAAEPEQAPHPAAETEAAAEAEPAVEPEPSAVTPTPPEPPAPAAPPQWTDVTEPGPELEPSLVELDQAASPKDIDVEPVPDPPGYAQLLRLASAIDPATPPRTQRAAELPAARKAAVPILPRIETRKPQNAPEPETTLPEAKDPGPADPGGDEAPSQAPVQAVAPTGKETAPLPVTERSAPADQKSDPVVGPAPESAVREQAPQAKPHPVPPPVTRIRREQIVVKATRMTPASLSHAGAAPPASRAEFANAGTWRPAREAATPAKAARPPAVAPSAVEAGNSPIESVPAVTPPPRLRTPPVAPDPAAPQKPAATAAPAPSVAASPPVQEKQPQAAATAMPAAPAENSSWPNFGGEPEPTSRWMLIAAPIAATLLLAGGGVYMIMSRNAPKPSETPARPAVVQAAPAITAPLLPAAASSPVSASTVQPQQVAKPPQPQQPQRQKLAAAAAIARSKAASIAPQIQAPTAAPTPADPRQTLCSAMKLAGPDCQSSGWVSRCAASGWSGERCLDERRKRVQACMDLGGTVDECATKHR
jgi:hypothetical protein